ncbi:Solute carrier family 22 member 13 [Holothuria leucospilota]|uniref:Solute carrier family 22 member 13 n=1 Tax=Holothuria leucospilota TaxID=206669 RepID=A0A9Q1BIK4_HOLLE|nr:Solute carrier family 22 member 13 [Holothuria leucospilota]
MATLDEIFKQTGKFGWFQFRAVLIYLIPTILTSMITFVQVFIAGEGDHWCKVGQWEEEGCKATWNVTTQECFVLMRNRSTPIFDEDDTRDTKCMKYEEAGTSVTLEEAYGNPLLLSNSSDVITCDEGWNFDRSVYQSTISEDWELICEKSVVRNLLQSIYFAGFVAGCLIFGTLADRIGRYYTFIISIVASGILEALCAFSPTVIFYAVVRLLLASTTYGSLLVGFVYVTEMALPETRVIVGGAVWYAYALGYVVLSGLARVVPSWRILIGIMAFMYIPLVPALLFMGESPRWLLTKGRFEEAAKIINRIAKVNGKQPPSEEELSKLHDQSIVYFGLSLGTSGLGVNVYVAFCISGAIEIPAYTVSIYSMKKLGRKWSTGTLMVLAGLSCFATIFAPEIFPTPLRTICVGTCSMSARVGGTIAPIVLVLEKLWKPLPLILFAFSSVLAGLLVWSDRRSVEPAAKEEVEGLRKFPGARHINGRDFFQMLLET